MQYIESLIINKDINWLKKEKKSLERIIWKYKDFLYEAFDDNEKQKIKEQIKDHQEKIKQIDKALMEI